VLDVGRGKRPGHSDHIRVISLHVSSVYHVEYVCMMHYRWLPCVGRQFPLRDDCGDDVNVLVLLLVYCQAQACLCDSDVDSDGR
jgi:hypothetical protein